MDLITIEKIDRASAVITRIVVIATLVVLIWVLIQAPRYTAEAISRC